MADLTATILDALDRQRQIEPPGDRGAAFSLEDAYAVSDALTSLRIARGDRVVGWKIGFTNRTIWDEYGVHAPIWGPMYERSVHAPRADGGLPEIDPDLYAEPRIEPEIAFRFRRPPRPGMDDAELLDCIDAACHGFEIVQSIYPGWRFAAADTVASGALHGAYLHGPLVTIEHHERAAWIERLASFSIALYRDDVAIDHGVSANVLGGPLSALRYFVDGIGPSRLSRGIEAGDIVTTGTLTRAFPIDTGQTWTTRLDGLPIPGVRLRLTSRFGDAVGQLLRTAARARFLFETPAASESADDYQAAVSDSIEAEAAIARLLFDDSKALTEAREIIARRAAELGRTWKAASGS